MTLVEIDGIPVSYLDVGDGPVALLVHGWTADGGDWVFQIPALLTAGYRVIVPDLRGHGSSASTDDGYDLAAGATRLVALLDHLAVDRTVVVGHSHGAALAGVLAADHPYRCAAVVMVDGSYGRERAVVETMVAWLLPALASADSATAVAGMLTRLHAPASHPGLIAWHVRRSGRVEKHVHQRMVGVMLDSPDSVFFRSEAEALLRRQSGPVLVVRAGSSVDQCEWERECLSHPRSEVHGWTEAGHWLHLEQPDRFSELLVSWLASLA